MLRCGGLMIDIYSYVLFGVDDGVVFFEEVVQMCCGLFVDGCIVILVMFYFYYLQWFEQFFDEY